MTIRKRFSLRWLYRFMGIMLLFASPAISAQAAPGDVMTTVAGIPLNSSFSGCVGGFAGDGGPALQARLNNPKGLVLDTGGNIYFSDHCNNRIRRIDKVSSIITTVAGSGTTFGFSGDGGSGNAAMLRGPNGLAFDAVGNLYIADTGNQRIRMITAGANGRIDGTDIITTVVGNGTQGFAGDGLPFATTFTSLNNPADIAFDAAGNMYIADEQNHRVRKVRTDGVVSTVAGTGVTGPNQTGVQFNGDTGVATTINMSRPKGVAIDAAGNLYITDRLNRLRKVAPGANGTIDGADQMTSFTIGTFGLPPIGVTIDPADNPVVAVAGSQIIQVNAATGVQTVLAGGGSFTALEGLATRMRLSPEGLAFDATGSLFIADSKFHIIRKVSPDTIAPSSGTISINNGAMATNNSTVNILPTCVDNSLVCDQLKLSNDGITFTAKPFPRFFGQTISWTLAAGPDGMRTVFAQAVDIAGNASSTFSNTITLDTTPPPAPVILSPADGSLTNNPVITVSGTTEANASVQVGGAVFAFISADGAGAWSTVSSALADGTHNITATATDAAGNKGPSSMVAVTVDTTAPTVSPPANITVAAVDASGTPKTNAMIANFLAGAAANDSVAGAITPTNDAPASFPLGVTTVTFSATDPAGNAGTGTATVTVTDQTAPVVSAPANITVTAVNPSGIPASDLIIAAFLGRATAVDNVDGAMTPVNNAPATFPFGLTPVIFSATDAAGNTGTAAAIVTVNSPQPIPTIAVALNQASYITGDTMTVLARTTTGTLPANADVYVALQLPDGTLLVMQPDGSFSTAITPLVANIPVPNFNGAIFNFTFSGAEPPGNYTWFAALTTPGTLNVIGTLAVAPFSFGP